MTPTREQIEAAAKAIEDTPVMCDTYAMSGKDAVNLATASLTAAAQVGVKQILEDGSCSPICAAAVQDDTIERCARVVDEREKHWEREGDRTRAGECCCVAAAIRALAKK